MAADTPTVPVPPPSQDDARARLPERLRGAESTFADAARWLRGMARGHAQAGLRCAQAVRHALAKQYRAADEHISEENLSSANGPLLASCRAPEVPPVSGPGADRVAVTLTGSREELTSVWLTLARLSFATALDLSRAERDACNVVAAQLRHELHESEEQGEHESASPTVPTPAAGGKSA